MNLKQKGNLKIAVYFCSACLVLFGFWILFIMNLQSYNPETRDLLSSSGFMIVLGSLLLNLEWSKVDYLNLHPAAIFSFLGSLTPFTLGFFIPVNFWIWILSLLILTLVAGVYFLAINQLRSNFHKGKKQAVTGIIFSSFLLFAELLARFPALTR